MDKDHLQKSTKIEPFYTLKNFWESSSFHYSIVKKTHTLKSSYSFSAIQKLSFFSTFLYMST